MRKMLLNLRDSLKELLKMLEYTKINLIFGFMNNASWLFGKHTSKNFKVESL